MLEQGKPSKNGQSRNDGISDDDVILPFQVGEAAVRGRVVRLGPALDQILSAHQFPNAVSELLGEAVSLVALMGAALKFDGKLIFQAQGDGAVSLLVADYSAGGALRATAKYDADALDSAVKDGELKDLGAALMGKGHLAMTVDQGPDMERYQGITALTGGDLAAASVAYFDQSEQIPTVIKLSVGRLARPGKADVWRAGGIIIQFMPGEGGVRERGEEILMGEDDREIWDRAVAFTSTVQADELLDPAISPETLLYRLFHEDGVRIYDTQSVKAECSCSGEKVSAVLAQYSEDELEGMVEDGEISVTCEFCRKDYRFNPRGELVRTS